MLKYVDYSVVFQEIPEETTLAFTISNCQGTCEGCHSPHLREDIGRDLEKDLRSILDRYEDLITCVLFLGEGNDPDALARCINIAAEKYNVALYSGKETFEDVRKSFKEWPKLLYLKTGSYKKELGPLTSPTTNQRLYVILGKPGNGLYLGDITALFWRELHEDSCES